MIAVIADDLTGAAELAGISLRFGLKVQMCTGELTESNSDVLIVSTDSRSMDIKEALRTTSLRIHELIAFRPEFIYKKTDSVLRGHVMAELSLQMQILHATRSILLPANPSLGRFIRDGRYLLGDRPIQETAFSMDPEFPVRSSRIMDMLRDSSVQILKPGDAWLPEGIMVGEASSSEDLTYWVNNMEPDILLAGAGDFFTALLAHRFNLLPHDTVEPDLPFLYVKGTAIKEPAMESKMAAAVHGTALLIDSVLISMDNAFRQDWMMKAQHILRTNGRLFIAFDDASMASDADPQKLREVMADLVRALTETTWLKEIFIDGGSTAAAVLDALRITRFYPVGEWQRGVVRMRAGNMHITVKPGSYPLPEDIVSVFRNH
jgi:hypothetical protein